MTTHHQAISVQLSALKSALIQAQLWEQIAPPPAALDSQMPFCCDTLRLEQWLQWLLIPRVLALIEAGHSLRFNCDIASYAEQYWPDDSCHQTVIGTIRRLDCLLSQR